MVESRRWTRDHMLSLIFVWIFGRLIQTRDDRTQCGRNSTPKIFSPPWKMCCTQFKIIGHSLKDLKPSQKTLRLVSLLRPARNFQARLDLDKCLQWGASLTMNNAKDQSSGTMNYCNNINMQHVLCQTELHLQATKTRKAADMHEPRWKEFKLLLHFIPLKE